MRSVRTNISILSRKNFEMFLYINQLDELSVGSWEENGTLHIRPKLCYAYSERHDTTPLTKLILKHGSIEQAFDNFLAENGDIDSCIGDIA